jgi:hypothetical protein
MAAGVLGDTVEQLYWSAEHKELKYQLGGGCLIDQALGQWHAGLYGLGDILDREKTATSLRSIYKHNFKERLGDIYNPCRVFGLDDESGTVITTWPDESTKPAVPVPYAQETMHGMEYAFGQMLMQYGMLEEGVKVTAGVRDRYTGDNRNPWNEIECGSNYARSMASWSGVVVMSGFSFDAPRQRLGFDPKVQSGGTFRSFWSGGNAYGTVELGNGKATLNVAGGNLELASLGLPINGDGTANAALNGRKLSFEPADDGIVFAPIGLKAGDVLTVEAPALSLMGLPDVARLQ